jgi:hypothetical protein
MDRAIFAKTILDIADSIESVSPKALVLRDTWHAYKRQFTLLSSQAPDNETISLAVQAGFFCWEIQGIRGPKSKDKVRQRLLHHLRVIIPIHLQLAK